MQKFLLIGAAGALGTLARYGVIRLVHRWTEGGFPWGTMTVNLLGSFLFGVVWSVAESRTGWGTQIRALGLAGFMGAFTTFSTYSFESAHLLRNADWWAAAGYMVGHNVLGVACLMLGLAAGRLI